MQVGALSAGFQKVLCIRDSLGRNPFEGNKKKCHKCLLIQLIYIADWGVLEVSGPQGVWHGLRLAFGTYGTMAGDG